MTLRNDAFEAWIDRSDAAAPLRVRSAESQAFAPFDGTAGPAGDAYVLSGALNTANARALQRIFPSLRPQFVTGHPTSVGTGDRLGLATAGQARAFDEHGEGVFPVLAQQSIREMDRVGRSAQDVMDDAVFGLVEAGWDRGFGADCDHIKTTEGIDRGIAAGFTMFTLDPGDHVQDVTAGITPEQVEQVPWAALGDSKDALLSRYVGTTLDLGHSSVTITEDQILTAAVKYGAAVLDAFRLYRHVKDNAGRETEIEFAVDETAWLTTFVEHYYLVSELKRLGAEWFSFAPRYVDGFEKGLEFKGDLEELRTNLEGHHAISQLFGGYKISLHSGSDKYSIYTVGAEALDGLVHLKTSGTSYLCALEVIARADPELFGQVWEISRAAYAASRASYQVSAHEDNTPATLAGLDTDATAALIAQDDGRQILHVGYGDTLNATLADGTPLTDTFHEVLRQNHAQYTDVVAAHIGRHIAPFSKVATARG